ncbi:ABC transporter ATP-binding protein [Cereibacter changlensis JA139]|uniref:ABC transporter ATP-binding protein n=2 Tax=Cereibacter changlensis TaxID=402884 RepID=A0A2T4JPN0_9RHOB|nr:ABC transporter ATP-binding protein [Cereibacter changlensis]PTE19834.1 ABC transporter ATP-binding protein [Cereibacter changlensis JA139]PZX51191.1 iron(III) transport system ATP-binding protein [Cereibacter changlensis]
MTKGSVRFEGVTKRYGDVVALKPLSLEIQRGTLCTLLGPSGCGKTTTLRLIAGLESASEGKILIGGEDVTHLSATYRRVSMVFQSYALFPHMTVAENVGYGLSVKRLPKAEARARAEAGLELVGLKGFGDRLPSELSGGQQQRVAVARAIVLEPEVLLLDEPLSNLDAKLRRHVREEIRQIQQRLGLTAVYVTHDQEEAMAVSDRIIVMKNAEIAQAGSPRDLYERPASSFIADFIGDANLLDAEVTASGAVTMVRLQGQEYTLPLATDLKGAARMVLRPHQVVLNAAPAPGSIPAEVTYAAYLGNSIQYTLASPAGEIFAILPPSSQPFAMGDTVHVTWRPEDIRLVAA